VQLSEEQYRLAKAAYEGYVKQAGGISLATGDKLPKFELMGAEIQEAWAAAGIAVLLEMDVRDDRVKGFRGANLYPVI
jgi:hypothetical protein